jgi:hypothetical protein
MGTPCSICYEHLKNLRLGSIKFMDTFPNEEFGGGGGGVRWSKVGWYTLQVYAPQTKISEGPNGGSGEVPFQGTFWGVSTQFGLQTPAKKGAQRFPPDLPNPSFGEHNLVGQK